jgi:hypothetical protein
MLRSVSVIGLVALLGIGCGSVSTTGSPGSGGSGATGGNGGTTGTGGSSGCTTGNEGCACFANNTCNGSLMCLSHLCVNAGGAGSNGSGGTTATGGVPGTGGSTGNGGSTGAGGAPSCLANSTDCTSTPNACCSGVCLENLNDPSQAHYCAAVCTADSQCESGCCATLSDSTTKACGQRGFCPETCAAAGVACTTSADCCANETCVTPSNTCAANCTTGSQCESGCCAALTNTSATGVCSDPIYCSTAAALERPARL